MNLIARLFTKTPSVQELRDQLKEIDQEQRKKRRDLLMLDQAKQEKVKRAVEAKKAGKQELLRDIFRDVSQVEIDLGNANNDLRRLSLTKTALSSFIRKAEMLETRKDHKSLQSLVKRFRDSSIQKTIDSAAVDDDTFDGMLEDVLGEEEGTTTRNKGKEDSGFADFDRAISQMAKADEPGADEPESSRLRDRPQVSATGPMTQDLKSWDEEKRRLEELVEDRVPWDDAKSPDKDKQSEFQEKLQEHNRQVEEEAKRIQERGEALKNEINNPHEGYDTPVPGTPDPVVATAGSTRSHPVQGSEAPNMKFRQAEKHLVDDIYKAADDETSSDTDRRHSIQEKMEDAMTQLQDEADRLQELRYAALGKIGGIQTRDTESDLEAQKKMEELSRAMEEAARLIREQQEAQKRIIDNIRTMDAGDASSDLEAQKKLEELNRLLEEAARLQQQQQEAAKGVIDNIRTMDTDADTETAKKAEELTRTMEDLNKLLKPQNDEVKKIINNTRV